MSPPSRGPPAHLLAPWTFLGCPIVCPPGGQHAKPLADLFYSVYLHRLQTLAISSPRQRWSPLPCPLGVTPTPNPPFLRTLTTGGPTGSHTSPGTAAHHAHQVSLMCLNLGWGGQVRYSIAWALRMLGPCRHQGGRMGQPGLHRGLHTQLLGHRVHRAGVRVPLPSPAPWGCQVLGSREAQSLLWPPHQGSWVPSGHAPSAWLQTPGLLWVLNHGLPPRLGPCAHHNWTVR